MKKLLLLLLFALPLCAQNNGTATQIRRGTALPQSCEAGGLFYKTTPPIGAHQCINGAWVYIAGGAGTNGTNGTNGQDGAPGADGYSPNQITSGCRVAYVSGLTFDISACNYIIANLPHTTIAGTVTGPAADASFPRIDVIAVNLDGTYSIVQGEAADNPAKPLVDTATQLEITHYDVAAGATTPGNINILNIYDECAEWTGAASAHVNCTSTVNPFSGTKDFEFTAAVAGNFARLTNPAGAITLDGYNDLVVRIAPKAPWTTHSLVAQWYNGTTAKCTPVSIADNQFVFNSGNTAYQLVVIPLSTFNCNGIAVTRLQFNVAGATGSIGLYLDTVYLQGGITANTGNSGMQWMRAWDPNKLYKVQDTATRNGTTYTAVLTNSGLDPVSNPIYWDPHDTHQPNGVDGNIQYKCANAFCAINSLYDPATQRVTFPGDVYATSLVATGTTNQSLTLVAATSPALSASGEIKIISNAGTCQVSQNGGAYTDCASAFAGAAVTSIATTSPITGGTITSTGTIACATCVVASAPGAGVAHFAGSTQTVTSSTIATADIAAAAVIPSKLSAKAGVRTCNLHVGDGVNTDTNASFGPFVANRCYIPYAATVFEIIVQADAGTPSLQIEKRIGASTVTNLMSGSLAANGTTKTCARTTTSATCTDGTTSSGSITISTTAIAAGGYIEVKDGTASTDKAVDIAVNFTYDD